MELHLGWKILFGFFFCIQLGDAGKENLDGDQILALQLKVENLVEKIINFIKDYYYHIKTDLKCIPDCVATSLMDTLKSSIDCVDENERNFITGKIQGKAHSKNFLKCFSDAKKEIENTLNSSNNTKNECPENVTEKTYEINVTTTFTKMFHINIKNGVEITKKEIQLGKNTTHCFDDQSKDKSSSASDEDHSETNETDHHFKEKGEVHKESLTEEKQKLKDTDSKVQEKKKEEKHKEKDKIKEEKHKEEKKIKEEKQTKDGKVEESNEEQKKTEKNEESEESEENEENEESEENDENEESEESEENEENEEEKTTPGLLKEDLLEEANLNITESEYDENRHFHKFHTPKEKLEDTSEDIFEIDEENIQDGRKSFFKPPDETEEELRRAEIEHDSFHDYEGASYSIYI